MDWRNSPDSIWALWNCTCFLLFHTMWLTQLLKYSQGMFQFVNYCVQNSKNCENIDGCCGDNPQSRHSTAHCIPANSGLVLQPAVLTALQEHGSSFDKWWQWHIKSSHENWATSWNGTFSWMMKKNPLKKKLIVSFWSLWAVPSGVNKEQVKHRFLTFSFLSFFFF